MLHHTATVLIPFIYFPYLGFSKNEKFYGPSVMKLYHKPASREWIDAGVFAIVAATIIRTFVFEAYVIPSGSMEKTLLVNDFLFVNNYLFVQFSIYLKPLIFAQWKIFRYVRKINDVPIV